MDQMRFIGLVLLKRRKMLMKMIIVMQGEGGAAAKEAANMASSGTLGSSLEITTWLRFQRSEGKAGSKLQ